MPPARAATLVALLTLASAGCKNPPAPNPGGPLARPILGVDLAAAAAANLAVQPPGFPGPQMTACAADVTRAFIAELADHPAADAQVQFHWAPVVAGPLAGKASVAQPTLVASGEVVSLNHSDLDTSFDHPFGFDFNVNLALDATLQSLAHNRDALNTDLHVEIEDGLFPQAAFGFTPRTGDRALLRGAWIWDCGHPPYETELHPPSFAAFAHAADARTTVAVALAVPWRVTQLFGPVDAVADFGDPSRLRLRGKGFPAAFQDEVLAAAATDKDHLEAHALLEVLRFESVGFSVCAPSPRPANVTLRWSHRFASRTGVTVTSNVREPEGCVDYQAVMTVGYVPAVPPRQDHAWPWAEISQQASDQSGTPIDVRQVILDSLRAGGLTADLKALRADHPPVIDRYPPLKPAADADQDSPMAMTTGADTQPYPFHGRVRVWWQ